MAERESATAAPLQAVVPRASAVGAAEGGILSADRPAWDRIRERQDELGTQICVGLDPVEERLPAGVNLVEFCLAIMEATAPFACAFKPNAAFFEAAGLGGWIGLHKVVAYARELGVPVILDGKRGDIGSTAHMYARAAFGALGADGLTVNPYLGPEAIRPILEYNGRAIAFVLCATSNPAAEVVQGSDRPDVDPLYLRVARLVHSLSKEHPNVGLVVGATRPEAMRAIRTAAPGLPWLVPGVGTQGGDLATVAELAEAHCIVNASRQILYAGEGAEFQRAAARAARELRDAFNECRDRKR